MAEPNVPEPAEPDVPEPAVTASYPAITNLDLLAATQARLIVQTQHGTDKDLERLINETLDHLQLRGIYGALLYLYAQKGEDILPATAIRECLLDFLGDPALAAFATPFTVQHAWAEVSAYLRQDDGPLADLDQMMLIHRLYTSILEYARLEVRT